LKNLTKTITDSLKKNFPVSAAKQKTNCRRTRAAQIVVYEMSFKAYQSDFKKDINRPFSFAPENQLEKLFYFYFDQFFDW
jgi:hypothetical protein